MTVDLASDTNYGSIYVKAEVKEMKGSWDDEILIARDCKARLNTVDQYATVILTGISLRFSKEILTLRLTSGTGPIAAIKIAYAHAYEPEI